jgi:hypothetical protein
MRSRTILVSSAAVCAALLLLADAPAARRAPIRSANLGATSPGGPARGGMIVGIDPETGRIGPASSAQRAELGLTVDQALSHSQAGLVEVHHPDGSVSIDLQGRFQEYAVGHIGPDGRPSVQCVDDRAALKRALTAPPPAPAALEEK